MTSARLGKRVLLALAVGLALASLPRLLGANVGPTADLSGKLGLASGHVSAGTFVFLFLGGVLTSLTPCVYPLIPITVSIFGARQETHRARSVLLSATYVGGIAAMYSALGVFAALSGKAFGTVLSSPVVVAVLALLLVALAASMFGAFELNLPSSVQEKLQSVRGGGFGGAFVMGLGAGVIAAPCTGPVLAGVLTWVGTERSPVLGFWMLFTYAIGMGVLFFVIGASSVRLPRSGPWMETVKSVLGVALLAAAIAMIVPLLPRRPELPVGTGPISLTAGLLAFAAVLIGALSLSFHGAAREKALKAVGLVALLVAIGLQLSWIGTPRTAAHAGPQAAGIHWLHDEKAALAEARASGKPLVVDFFAEWCAACKELDLHVWSQPDVQKVVSDRFVALKVDATDENDENERLLKKYGIPGLPTVLMMACNDPKPAPGPECNVPQAGPGRVTGFIGPPEMIDRLKQVAQ